MKAKDISNLYLFCQAVEAGGFASASQQTHVSAPTLSRAVSHLEDLVGEKLVHRNAKQFLLTTAGEEYYQRFSPIFTQLDEQWLKLSNVQTTLTGDIRITCPEPFAEFFMQQLAIEFMTEHPEVNISIQFSGDESKFFEERIDLAVIMAPPKDNNLVQRTLIQTPVVLAASPKYLERYGTPTSARDLYHHKLLVSSRVTHWEFKHKGELFKIPVTPRYSVLSMRLSLDAAVAGLGICLIPIESFNEHSKDGNLVQLIPDAEFPIGSAYLIWADRTLIPARVRAFKDLILKRFNQPSEYITYVSKSKL